MTFTRAAFDFYDGLEFDNSREYFQAHRELYDSAVVAPLRTLTAALEDEFGAAKLFRPNRDVRFSADKSPYKTNQSAAVRDPHGFAYYLSFSAGGLFVAGGWHEAAPDQIQRYRAAVASDAAGADLTRIAADLEAQGFALGGDKMVTRPRGIPEDHARIELLRHRSLTASKTFTDENWLASPAVLEQIRLDWRALRPLNAWLGKNVGASEVARG